MSMIGFETIAFDLDAEHQLVWPNTAHFGNGLNDLIHTYTTNLKTNLFTHAKKRLRQYLLMLTYERNSMNPLLIRYEDEDVDRVVAWSIFGIDTIDEDDPHRVMKKTRRDILLQVLTRHSWFEMPLSNIGAFTKFNWFKSIPFWLALQRQLDEFNSTEAYREQRRVEREHFRYAHSQRIQSSNHCACGLTKKGPPRVRNLVVIPICSFTRTHFTVDNLSLYTLLCGLGLIPTCKGIKKERRQMTQNEFFANKQWVWNAFFNMRKIRWFTRFKKDFRYRFLSDGISASLQYDTEKTSPIPIEKQQQSAVNKYIRNGFENESGTDPGVNTWQAITLRTISTQKEVRTILSLYIIIISFQYLINYSTPLFR